ncbi:anti-sigma factor family protein [Lignipirellula cremea]|uniref:Putative zinc-finger domain-containing protein n=1 Tax=Lignipirellula cremea TaxID=2528010 RepID=A0A518DUJ0_9BACT|nr:zf-HC2 domain-containing protein [Lignipirellula cremea]QDU95507.1 hypothetical protein Pla8534_33220 [Lignipirellula cremea]
MRCQDFVDFLIDYVDQELAAEVREEFEKHMNCCPPCVAYLRHYEISVRLGRSACASEHPLPEPPEQLVNAVLAAIRKRNES